MYFSKHSRKRPQNIKTRGFHLEPLEQRLLLSAGSWEMLPPGGMQAFEYYDSATVAGGGVKTFSFGVEKANTPFSLAVSTPAGMTATVTIRQSNNSVGTFNVPAGATEFWSSLTLTSGLAVGTCDVTVTTAGNAGTITLDVLSGGIWEKEISMTSPNNNSRATAQNITEQEFLSIAMTTGTKNVSRAVVVGKFDSAGTDDWYSFELTGNRTVDLQLYAPGCKNLVLELYNSSGTRLAAGTSVDEIRSYIDNYTQFSQETVYLRVAGSVGSGTVGTGTVPGTNGRYTLTIYRNASFEIENNDVIPGSGTGVVGGSLDADRTAFGSVSSGSQNVSENVLTLSGSPAFGRAISVDGNRMAVTTNDGGAAGRKLSVYEYTGTQWVQKASVTFTEESGTLFGNSVSFSGNYIILGAQNEVSGGTATGAAYIYKYENGTLTRMARLSPGDLSEGDSFGTSVAIYGTTAVVSAPKATVGGVKSGAVYVYQFNGTSWALEAKFAGGQNGGVSSTSTAVAANGLFGTSAAYDGTYLVVGAPQDKNDAGYTTGAAYVYARTSSGWVQVSRLLPPDTYGSTHNNIYFGTSVDISDGIIAVGATGHHSAGSNTGAVYAWHLKNVTGTGLSTRVTWENRGILTPQVSTTEMFFEFGCAVSVEQGKILAGASSAIFTTGSVYDSGAAFLFEYVPQGSGSSAQMGWARSQMLTPKTVSVDRMLFGRSVAFMNGTACVAASRGGSVHTFSNLSDWDSWTLNVETPGTTINVGLYALASGTSAVTGLTVPMLEVYDPNGTLLRVFTAAGNSTSFTNSFTPSMKGTYMFIVRAAAGTTCQYALEVHNNAGNPAGTISELKVEGVSPQAGETVSAVPATVTVRFSRQVLATGLGTARLEWAGGNVTLTNPTLLDGNTVRWTVPSGLNLPEGPLTITLYGTQDIQGKALAITGYQFSYDKTPPTVTKFTQLASTATTNVPFAEIIFSEPMAENFSSSNIILSGSSSGVIPVIPTYNAATHTLTLSTAGKLPDEYYTLTLKSGFDGFHDLAGLSLAGSGGVAGTDFVTSFFLDSDEEVPFGPLVSVGPAGALIRSTSANASLSSNQDKDNFTISLKANQILSVEVEGKSSGMRPVIEIYKAGGATPLYTSSSTGTSTATISGVKIPSDGDYIIRVSSESAGIAGLYTVRAILEAGVEKSGMNDTIGTAQPLPDFWTPTGSFSHSAIVGKLDDSADVDYYSVSISAGATMSFALTGTSSYLAFAIYDSAGTLYAQGCPSSDGTMQEIPRFKNDNSAQSKTFYIKVWSTVGAGISEKVDYQLIAMNAGVGGGQLESESNDLLSSARELTSQDGVLGTVTTPVVSVSGAATLDVKAVDTSSLTPAQLASFGNSAAISGNWAVLGSGSYAAIYHFENGKWNFHQTLTLTESVAETLISSVAIDGNCLVLGAVNAYRSGKATPQCGAVYIYRLQGSGWVYEAKFSPTDGEPQDHFGYTAAINGGTIAVSARLANEANSGHSNTGAVYILQKVGGVWTQTAKITASDAPRTEFFGSSLSLKDGMLAVGATNDLRYGSGKVYIYQYLNSRWVETQIIQPSQQSGALFGAEVKISGEWMAVSAPGQTAGGAQNAGAVYIYRFNATLKTWSLHQPVLVASSPVANDHWGAQLVLDGTKLFIASGPDSASAAGVVECYTLQAGSAFSTGTWTREWANTVTNSGRILLAYGADHLLNVYPNRGGSLAKIESWGNFRDVDFYSFKMPSGSPVPVLNIGTPADATGLAGTQIPLVEIFDGSGTLVLDNTGAVKTSITLTGLAAGATYYVRVTAPAGQSCNYRLTLSRSDSVRTPVITDATHENAAITNIADASVTLHFSEHVNFNVLKNQLSQIKITSATGAIYNCASYEIVDGKTVRFLFGGANLSQNGNITVSVPANTLADMSGGYFSGFSSTYKLDTVAPTLAGTSLSTGNMLIVGSPTASASLTLSFSEELITRHLQAADFILIGSISGRQSVQSIDYTLRDGKTEITLYFGVLPQDHYTVMVNPITFGLRDLAGNTVSANFSQEFTLGYPSGTIPVSGFQEAILPGSLIYEKTVSGYLTGVSGGGSVHEYTVTVSPGQQLSAAVSLTGLQNVTLTVGRGAQPDASDSTTTGAYLSAGPSLVTETSQAQTYRITVTNLGGSAGTYDLKIFLNSLAEAESDTPGTSDSRNNVPTGAQNLSASGNALHSLGGTDASAKQLAVMGSLSSGTDVDWYRFTVDNGAAFSAVLGSVFAANISLELYGVANAYRDTALSLITENCLVYIPVTASVSATELRLAPVSALDGLPAGIYYLKVSAGTLPSGVSAQDFFAEYGIVILQNTVLNQEPNDTFSTAQNLQGMDNVLGHVTGSSTSILPRETMISEEIVRGAKEGYSVAASGDIILVGAPGANRNGESSGAVSVYRSDGAKWVLLGYLEGTGVTVFDKFGTAVAVEGNTAVVSATGHVNENGSTGAVYIFEFNGVTWKQTATLANPGSDGGIFGADVDISGDRMIVGSPGTIGAAYIYRRDAATRMWSWEATIQNLGMDATGSGFGTSVAISGTTVVIGAPTQSVTYQGTEYKNAGAIHVYQRAASGNTWNPVSVFSAADTGTSYVQANALFGSSVDIQDSRITAGAPNETVGGFTASGAAYVFLRNTGGVWGASQRITQETAAANEHFGCSVSLDGDSLLVGASGRTESGNANVGSAWLFQTTGATTWFTRKEMLSSQGVSASAHFGASVAMNGGTAVVGAPDGTTAVKNADGVTYQTPTGAAYIFRDAADTDVYAMLPDAARKITVTLALPPGENSELGNNMLISQTSVKLYGMAGNEISGTFSNNTWTFASGFSVGETCYLVVSAGSGRSGEYVLHVEGVQKPAPGTLNYQGMTPNTSSGTLTSPPAEINVTFSAPVRGDYINLENISINTGAATIHPLGVRVSKDGKTVTLLMPTDVPYYTDQPTISILPNTFYGLNGGKVSAAINGSFYYRVNTVNVKTQVNASETATSVTWTFAENMNIPQLSDADFLLAFQVKKSGTGQNLVGGISEFTRTATSVTWTSPTPLEHDTRFTVTLDGMILHSTSGAILAGMTDGKLIREYTVNLNDRIEAALVVKDATTLSTVNSTGEAAAIPDSLKWVDEWRTVWVEVWAYVISGNADGLTEFDATLSYQRSLFVPSMSGGNYEFVPSAPFTGANGGMSVTAGAGNTLQISASTTLTNVGDNGDGSRGQYVMIGRVKFVPNSIDPASATGVKMNLPSKKLTPVESGFSLEVTGGKTSSGSVVQGDVLDRSLPAVYPVVYDLNDDGIVNIQDLILFIGAYGANINTTTNTAAWACDFEPNGKIDIFDLILFIQNYGMSRRSTGTVKFSAALTANWGNTLFSSPAASIQEMSAAINLTEEEMVILVSLETCGLLPGFSAQAFLCEISGISIQENEGSSQPPGGGESQEIVADISVKTPGEISGAISVAASENTDTLFAAVPETREPLEIAGGVSEKNAKMGKYTPPTAEILPALSVSFTTRDDEVLQSAVTAAILPSADISGIHFLKFSGNVLAAEIGNVKWLDGNTPPVTAGNFPVLENEKEAHREKIFAENAFSEIPEEEGDYWMWEMFPQK